MLILVILLLLLFGGGGFYVGGPQAGFGIGGILLVVLIVPIITGRL